MKHQVTLLALLALGGCSDSKSNDSSSPTPQVAASKVAPSSAAAAAPAPKLLAKKIPSIGLEIDVSEGATVEENAQTQGVPGATVYASPTLFIQTESETYKVKTLVAHKEEIKQQPGNTLKQFTKEEGDDGAFVLEFDLNSMFDEPLYGFVLRETINGKRVDCSTNSESPEERAHGIAMCKSLRAAK